MKILFKIYLIENMDGDNLDILDNAIIVASCLTEAKQFIKKEWPELKDIEIIEINQSFLKRLNKNFPNDKILCISRVEL